MMEPGREVRPTQGLPHSDSAALRRPPRPPGSEQHVVLVLQWLEHRASSLGALLASWCQPEVPSVRKGKPLSSLLPAAFHV